MKKITFALLAFFIISACGVNRQAKELKALEDCEYKITSADSVYIVGKPLQSIIKGNEVDLSNLPSLAFAMLRKNVPVTGRINLNITNPKQQKAGINQFEYIVLLKDKEIANGFVDQQISIAPGASVDVPIKLKINAYSLLQDNNVEEIMKLLSGEESNADLGVVTLKIKPSIAYGDKFIKYPGYITIDKKISRDIFL